MNQPNQNPSILSKAVTGLSRLIGATPTPESPESIKTRLLLEKVTKENNELKRSRSVKKRHTVPDFNTTVNLDDETRAILSRVFINHRTFNTIIKEAIFMNREISVNKLKSKVYQYIEENGIKDFIPSCLDKEIKYIRKKMHEGKNPRAGATSYISLSGSSSSNDSFTFNAKKTIFMVESLELMMKLNAPATLPEEGTLFHISIGTTNVETLEDLDFNIYVTK